MEVQGQVLVAGFDKFGPYPANVSGELVGRLNGTVVELQDGVRFQIVGLHLPIDFGRFRRVLSDGIQEANPVLVLGLGMDFKDLPHLSCELLARRAPLYGRGFLDEQGQEGSLADLDDLEEVLRVPHESEIRSIVEGIEGVGLSEDAGQHMCETVLRDAIRLSENGKRFQPAFLHAVHTEALIPFSEQLEAHRHWMPIDQQESIVRTTLKALLSARMQKAD